MRIIDRIATWTLLVSTMEHRPELTPQQMIDEWRTLDIVSRIDYPEDRVEYLRELKKYYEVEATQHEYEEAIEKSEQLERSGLLWGIK